MATSQELLNKRYQRRSVMNRHLNTAMRKKLEYNSRQVLDRLQSAQQTFDELEAAHYDFHESLTESKDIRESEYWFQSALDEYSKKVDELNSWLISQSIDPASGDKLNVSDQTASSSSSEMSGDISKLSSDLANLLSLPTLEVPVFDGDPRQYQVFVTTFDEVIGNKLPNGQAKLTRLLMLTKGDAHKAVESCINVGGADGYLQAREILKQRYGSKHVIAKTVLEDIRDGKPAIKPADLRRLSDDLYVAHSKLSSLGAYSEINSQSFIRDVLLRCHSKVRGKWGRFATDARENTSEYPGIDAFVKFIKRESIYANDPMFGYEALKTTRSSASCNQTTGKPRAAGQAQDDGTCCACQAAHSLVQCSKFNTMRVHERLDLVRSNRLCFCCFSSMHFSRDCPRSVPCPVSGCGGRHHKLVHCQRPPRAGYRTAGHATQQSSGKRASSSPQPESDSKQVPTDKEEAKTGVATCCYGAGEAVYLPLVKVLVFGCPAIALLDSGSTHTLVSSKFVNELGLVGQSATCVMNTVGAQSSVASSVMSLDMCAIDDDREYRVCNVFVVSDIPAETPDVTLDLSMYDHLSDLPFSVREGSCKADLIIGMDNAHLIVPLEVRRSETNVKQPYATRTLLGWALHGPVPSVDRCDKASNLVCNQVNLQNLDVQIEKLWDIEHDVIDAHAWSVDDCKVYDLWERETVFSEGHYEVPVPWREGEPNMPNNRFLAEKRLDSTVKRLVKTGMYETYQDNLFSMVAKGYAEPVTDSQLKGKEGRLWYLPHQCVLRADKPGKVRIVFDCAAKYRGMSLNSQCFRGPDLCNKLVHVLVRFRQYQYAVTGDIAQMYLQVRIPEKDRDCLRFLWRNDSGELMEYRMTSHLFGGIWCASSSTYALRKTLQDFHSTELVRESVEKSMYVDDLLKSLITQIEAMAVICGSKDTLAEGGFDITQFLANDPEVMSVVPEQDRAQEIKEIAPQMYSKALGLHWDVTRDDFMYKTKHEVPYGPVTKRIMLSLASSMYDPLGLIMPIIISGRFLFQEATKLKLNWDEPVPSALETQWKTWWVSLEKLERLKFPRCLLPDLFADSAVELHHFADASNKAYGAVTYVRATNKVGSIRVTLLMAKGRVTPLKPITIPRLELCAAVTAVGMDQMLRRELQVCLLPSTFWTDSQIILAYIRSEAHRFKVFVANRVSCIREHSQPEQWRYVPTNLNPADVASRGCSAASMPTTWINGPPFLSQHKNTWKDHEKSSPKVSETKLEVKPVSATTLTIVVSEHILSHGVRRALENSIGSDGDMCKVWSRRSGRHGFVCISRRCSNVRSGLRSKMT